jgi:hypothetical protein
MSQGAGAPRLRGDASRAVRADADASGMQPRRIEEAAA